MERSSVEEACGRMRVTYTVEVDGVMFTVEAASLAEVCNKVRGTGERFRVWAPSGLLVVDTKFGDAYDLSKKQGEL